MSTPERERDILVQIIYNLTGTDPSPKLAYPEALEELYEAINENISVVGFPEVHSVKSTIPIDTTSTDNPPTVLMEGMDITFTLKIDALVLIAATIECYNSNLGKATCVGLEIDGEMDWEDVWNQEDNGPNTNATITITHYEKLTQGSHNIKMRWAGGFGHSYCPQRRMSVAYYA